MSSIPFNTHTFVKRLTAVGMPEEQAEVLAEQQAELIDQRLATKDDLKSLEHRLVSQLTTRFGIMIGGGVAVVGVIISVFTLLK